MATARESKVTIKIPRPLYNRLKRIIDDSGFDSVTDFVVYILRDFAAGTAAAQSENETSQSAISDKPDSDDAVALTAQEVQKVRERLKRLGYL